MSGYAKRVTGIVVGAAIVCVLLGLYIGVYLTSQPGAASAAQSPAGAHLYLGTVPASEGTDPHPSWVSYYAVDAEQPQLAPRHDLHPAGQLRGARHGLQLRRAERVAQPVHLAGRGNRRRDFTLDGKPTKTIDPDAASHIFAIPQLGVSVPIYGVPDDAKNQCANAPCGLDTRAQHHHVHLPHGQAGAVSLAVLRPVRRRLHRRVGRADADGRLHGRLHQGRMRGLTVMSEVNHWRRVVLWWLGTSIVATLLVVLLLAPILPAGQRLGRGLGPGGGQHRPAGDLHAGRDGGARLLHLRADRLPRARHRRPSIDGPPIRGDAKVQTWWLVVTTGIVLFLAGYGTVRLLADGAGGGQGPNPIAAPAGSKDALQVQVIAQQWKFTYRWPSYGGVETPTIELPAHRMIEFHVTSLDVIHSFWAYQLGVKADAEPRLRQHRLRHHQGSVDLQRPLRGAVRRVARLHVRDRARGEPERLQDVDRPAASAVRAGDQEPGAVLASSTSRTRRGEADDHSRRSQPDRSPHGASCSASTC